jgi:hypothetical protein
VAELDLNPVLVFPEDQPCIALDARVLLRVTQVPSVVVAGARA